MGVRELKTNLSRVLRRVGKGEAITVTDRDRPVAMLVPLRTMDVEERLRHLARAGLVSWSGGKPRGSARPIVVRGKPVSESVLEDRGDPLP